MSIVIDMLIIIDVLGDDETIEERCESPNVQSDQQRKQLEHTTTQLVEVNVME